MKALHDVQGMPGLHMDLALQTYYFSFTFQVIQSSLVSRSDTEASDLNSCSDVNTSSNLNAGMTKAPSADQPRLNIPHVSPLPPRSPMMSSSPQPTSMVSPSNRNGQRMRQSYPAISPAHTKLDDFSDLVEKSVKNGSPSSPRKV